MESIDFLTLICQQLPAATRINFMKLSHACWDITMQCSEYVEIDAETLTKHRILAKRSNRWAMDDVSLVRFGNNQWAHVTILSLTNDIFDFPLRLDCATLPLGLQSLSIEGYALYTPESLKRLPLVNFRIKFMSSGVNDLVLSCIDASTLPATLEKLYCSKGCFFQTRDDGIFPFPRLRKCIFVDMFIVNIFDSYPIGCDIRNFHSGAIECD